MLRAKGNDKADQRLLSLCSEISQIYEESPESIPKDDLREASKLLSIFRNQQFSEKFKNFRLQKHKLFDKCLLDIARGGDLLRTGTFDICFFSGRLKINHRQFGEPPEGEVVISVTLKKQAAFQKFKENEADEISQQDINRLCLYFACARASGFRF
jgi:hypothetical protein